MSCAKPITTQQAPQEHHGARGAGEQIVGIEAYERLAVAVIERAIKDAESKDWIRAEEARHWLLTTGTDWAAYFDITPEAVRARIESLPPVDRKLNQGRDGGIKDATQ